MAYTDTRSRTGSRDIQLFLIDQLIAAGTVANRTLLPSMRYHPAEQELPPSAIVLPWSATAFQQTLPPGIVGEWARELGAKSPGRLIASAKSWLSHGQVDRSAPILPWGAAAEVPKLSPLAASASYLAHIHSAWNQHFPDFPLAQQDVILTLPASFDEGARMLTLQAAELAGLDQIHLLEEPQAACYDWIYRQGNELAAVLDKSRLLLVCDVGGGTTDLSLIRVNHGATGISLTRIAVGDHLMLGGDNMDLAIAHIIEPRLNKQQRLSSVQLAQLVQQCRFAKERLLTNSQLDRTEVTLPGTGSRLIGGARSAQLHRRDLAEIIDGFLPRCEPDEFPRTRRGGIVEFGLPFAADPAISKHVAAFLSRFRDVIAETGDSRMPDTVLLNGGVFHSNYLAQRLLEILSHWRRSDLQVLHNPQPDLAVARGAVAYGLARRGKGLKIGGGAARSYFLQIDKSDDRMGKDVRQAVCLLPRGAAESREFRLEKQRFALRLGQPVRFRLLSATAGKRYRAGELVLLNDECFEDLPPLATVLEGDGGEVPVQLVAALSEIGTLTLACVQENNPQQRWKLEFQLRGDGREQMLEDSHSVHARFNDARALIEQYFGDRSSRIDPKGVKTLRSDLEKLLGSRDSWELSLLRGLFTTLLDGARRRRRSVDHERLWFNLIGFTLRPGFGDTLDDWRVEQLWPLYSQSVQFAKEAQNWAEWWTLWRRIAGGLQPAAQETIARDLEPYLLPPKRQQKIKGPKKLGYEDMVRLVAALEHLPSERKAEIGGWLLDRLRYKTESVQTWWALGRIGARVPFHGSAHQVVSAEIAANWLTTMLQQDWRKIQPIAFAATMLARLSGDRERDLSSSLRLQTMQQLRAVKAPDTWVQMVAEVRELDDTDTKRVFGEALPAGLKLLH